MSKSNQGYPEPQAHKQRPTEAFATALQMAINLRGTDSERAALINSTLFSNSYRDRVRAFHLLNGQEVRHTAMPDLSNVSVEELALRINLTAEEFVEFIEAFGLKCTVIFQKPDGSFQENHITLVEDDLKNIDAVNVADASADLKYILEGNDLTFGINSEAVFTEVHASNMTKLGVDGKPVRREDGKILKGPNFVMPDLGYVVFNAE